MSYLALVHRPREQAQLSTAVPNMRPSDREIEQPLALLNGAGTRIVIFEAGDEAIGIWSDLNSAQVRAAIRTLGFGELPVVYLDFSRCPDVYKIRRVPASQCRCRSSATWRMSNRPAARDGKYETNSRSEGNADENRRSLRCALLPL